MCYNNENIVFNFAKLLLRHIIIPFFLKKLSFIFLNIMNYLILKTMQLQTL